MIHAKHYGESGPALVVIHGLFGNADNWHSIAQTWAETLRVYCVDLPNHGQSSALEDASYPNMANALLDWAEQEGLDSFYLLGHSMGGKVAMQMAQQAPEKIKKLIVADIAPVDYSPSHTKILEGLKAIDEADIQSRKEADAILSEYESAAPIRQFLLKNLTKTDSGLKLSIGRANIAQSYPTILKRPVINDPISVPTLFIKGEKSDYIIAEYQDTIMTLFPNAEFKILAGTGHWLHAEKPAPFASLVKRFCTQ